MKRTLLRNYNLFVKGQETRKVYLGEFLINAFSLKLHLGRKTYLFLSLFFCMLGITPVNATVYYVSNSGSDSNSGTSSATAWLSLSKVNSFAFRAGDQILFKRGDQWEGTITVNASGASGNPIVYGAYGSGDNPKIYGSEEITGWTLYSGNIYQANCTEAISQLFIDDNRMQSARYPNEGFMSVSSVSGTAEFTSSDLKSGIDDFYKGAKLIIKTSEWRLDTRDVVSSDGQSLTIDSGTSYGLKKSQAFFLTNKLSFLDKAGQWYYDDASNIIYLWTPSGDSPDNYEIKGSVYDDGFVIRNKDYITIKDLNMLHQNENGINSEGNNITIENNFISGVETNGIRSRGLNCILIKNRIVEINHVGITHSGANSIVSDNELLNTALFANLGVRGIQGYSQVITLSGDNNIISYNRVVNAAYNGITWTGQNCNLSYNYVENVCTYLSDGGGIYTYSHDVNELVSSGSIVAYNIVYNCHGTASLYMDNRTRDVLLEYNTVVSDGTGGNIGLFFHDNMNVEARYNTIFNNKTGTRATGTYGGNLFHHNIVCNIAESNQGGYITELAVVNTDEATLSLADNTYVDYHRKIVFTNASHGYLTFDQWQVATGEVGSSIYNTSLADGEKEFCFYNDTKATKTIDLGGYIYRDIYGKEISGKFTLEPFTSRILIKTTKKVNQAPEIKGQTFNIDGDSPKNTFVGQVIASDADADQTLSYSIVGGNNDNLFYINSSNGQIYTKEDFKYAEDVSVTLLVKVTDNATSPLSAQANVVINIQGVIFPDITPPAISSFSIPNTASSLTVAITSFVANDNTGVTGYKVTENMISSFSAVSGWDNTIPKTYTFSSFGAHTLYAWVIDAAGNISNVASSSVTIYDLSPVYTSEDKVICEGESYMGWTASGEYKRTLQTSIGADSIVTTSLYVNPVIETTENISIKEGESYQGWTTSGSYQRTLTSVTGCDSIVTTNLTVAETLFTDEDITICSGESYLGWTTAGQYERTLEASSGVDSIVTTNLYVNPVKKVTENISIKEGNSYQGWTTGGNYQRTLTSATGCDSIVTTILTVAETLFTAEDITICAGESYFGWTTAGQYERTLEASSGADSIVTTSLYVNPVKKITENILIKEGESYQGWTTSGSYQRTLTSATGCDSIVTTNLTVAETLFTVEDITICSGESYLGWTTAGQYERTLEASSGADWLFRSDCATLFG